MRTERLPVGPDAGRFDSAAARAALDDHPMADLARVDAGELDPADAKRTVRPAGDPAGDPDGTRLSRLDEARDDRAVRATKTLATLSPPP